MQQSFFVFHQNALRPTMHNSQEHKCLPDQYLQKRKQQFQNTWACQTSPQMQAFHSEAENPEPHSTARKQGRQS